MTDIHMGAGSNKVVGEGQTDLAELVDALEMIGKLKARRERREQQHLQSVERERDQLREQLARRTAQLHDAINILGWSKAEWQE